LAPDLRDVLQRRRPRLRHRRSVPAARGRVLRAAQSRAHGGPAPWPTAGDPVGGLLRGSQRAHVPDGHERGTLHPAVRGCLDGARETPEESAPGPRPLSRRRGGRSRRAEPPGPFRVTKLPRTPRSVAAAVVLVAGLTGVGHAATVTVQEGILRVT